VGRLDITKVGTSTKQGGSGWTKGTETLFAGTPGYWGKGIQVIITGGVNTAAPIITATINNSGIIGAQILTNYDHYTWGFYIQIGDIPNSEGFIRVSFTYIEADNL
jgi:hypothetical protein